jgi:hypothetical protein
MRPLDLRKEKKKRDKSKHSIQVQRAGEQSLKVTLHQTKS